MQVERVSKQKTGGGRVRIWVGDCVQFCLYSFLVHEHFMFVKVIFVNACASLFISPFGILLYEYTTTHLSIVG